MNSPAGAMPGTRAVIEQGMADGLHIGAQVYVSRHGLPIADLAFGEARPGVAMTPDTLMLWLSGSKPIGAAAIAQLWERGMLALDDPVARHIPEFAQNGKEPVTLRHLLTHTGGFRWIDTGWPQRPWEQVIARICAAAQERAWVAGQKAGYSPITSWFILGEIVRRLDGRDYPQYVREEILEPLGMGDCCLALPPDRYRAYGNRIGIMQKTDKEAGPADAGLESEQAAAACSPAGGGRGPARELAKFYEMLLGTGPPLAASRSLAHAPRVDPTQPWNREASGGPGSSPRNLEARNLSPILLPQTMEALTARHRTGMKDQTFNHVMDWGLGFMVNSAIYGPDTVPYGFGPHASPRAYGHGGSQSSASFADPEHGLAVVVILNGMPGEPAHQKRIRAILRAIYEDIGLARTAEG